MYNVVAKSSRSLSHLLNPDEFLLETGVDILPGNDVIAIGFDRK